MSLATDHNDSINLGGSDLETLIVGLILTVLVACFVWIVCRAAGRPDWGSMAAAGIGIVGALLTLLAIF